VNEWTDDVTDLVRDANPVPPSRAAGWGSSDEGAGVEAEVRARLTSGAVPTRTHRSRRVTLLLAAALALVVVIASGSADNDEASSLKIFKNANAC
jgi:hypothetical protein